MVLRGLHIHIGYMGSNAIRIHCDKVWYPESLYLLAMVDHLSRTSSITICEDYDDIRKTKLAAEVYPAGIIALSGSQMSDVPKQQAVQKAIPEFLRFNIVENGIRGGARRL